MQVDEVHLARVRVELGGGGRAECCPSPGHLRRLAHRLPAGDRARHLAHKPVVLSPSSSEVRTQVLLEVEILNDLLKLIVLHSVTHLPTRSPSTTLSLSSHNAFSIFNKVERPFQLQI